MTRIEHKPDCSGSYGIAIEIAESYLPVRTMELSDCECAESVEIPPKLAEPLDEVLDPTATYLLKVEDSHWHAREWE